MSHTENSKSAGMPATICLNMIVKNEIKNLERCLTSVAPHIKSWVIADTGSTDGTQDFIKSFFAARGIPGELHEYPFIDFSQARNDALQRAWGTRLDYDYLLLTDADMELVVHDAAFANDLSDSAYSVKQNSGVTYWNTRLVRRGASARYKGVTHEFLDVVGRTGKLEGISFIDHATGANREGKYERDARLLQSALESEQDAAMIARYTFYLANTLRDAGQPEAALAAYEKRAALGHWQQEVFVSLYNAAGLKQALGHAHDVVISAYEKATAAAPTRAEALHGAARCCRNNQRYAQGYEFAKRGLAISNPNDGLFVEDWIYQYGLLDELSVNAYWAGKFETCLVASDRLLLEGNMPRDQHERVRKNRDLALAKHMKWLARQPNNAQEFLSLLGLARAKEEASFAVDDVISSYEAASKADPMRGEAWHGASRYCRIKGLHEKGYQFATAGLAIQRPETAETREDWIYDYGLLDELAVTAYWTGRFRECLDACQRLLDDGKLPYGERARVQANKTFALSKLDKTAPHESSATSIDAPNTSLPPDASTHGGIRTFDLFDTLVARRDPDPKAVFRIVEERSGHVGFATKRGEAERRIFGAPYTLSDIYAYLIRHFAVSSGEADRLRAIELAVEEECIYPISEIVSLLRPDDAIVSDMYLSEDELRLILRRSCNINPKKLYVSSHGKRSGRIWSHVKSNGPISEHIGDNEVTDGASAKAAGIKVRLTSLSKRTAIEAEIADLGYPCLSNLVREARLTTCSVEPAFRIAQLAQIEVNFPLLFLATAHLLRCAQEAGWDNILFSARDCFLWSKLYDILRRLLPVTPPAAYFYTGRSSRAHPSADYLDYFARIRTGQRNVVADLCGTGWSLSRLIEQSTGPSTEIFLLHHIHLPELVNSYAAHGHLEGGINVRSLVRRAPSGGDNDVLEDLNRALHPAVDDVRRIDGMLTPVFSSIGYERDAVALIRTHHEAFSTCCGVTERMSPQAFLKVLESDATEAIAKIYRRMGQGMISSLEPLLRHKKREEAIVWENLQKNSEQDGRKSVRSQML